MRVRAVREKPIVVPPPSIESVVVELNPAEAEVLCLELSRPYSGSREISKVLHTELLIALNSKYAG